MALQVELVVPDRRVWSGTASMVIAKTLDGDIGVLTNHPPIIGVLATGSIVRVLDPVAEDRGAGESRGRGGARAGRAGQQGDAQPAAAGAGNRSDAAEPDGGQQGGVPAGTPAGGEITAAVSGGFLSVSDDRVSILATDAQLGGDVDTDAVRTDLESALAEGGPQSGEEEPVEIRYARALLRAAGEE